MATQQLSLPRREVRERVLLSYMLQFMCFPCRQGVSSSVFYGATLLEETDDIRDEVHTTTATVGCLPSFYQPPTTQQFSRVAYHITPTPTHHATIIQRFYTLSIKLKVRDSIIRLTLSTSLALPLMHAPHPNSKITSCT